MPRRCSSPASAGELVVATVDDEGLPETPRLDPRVPRHGSYDLAARVRPDEMELQAVRGVDRLMPALDETLPRRESR
ncbi:hypothetical protein [Nonomuraea indica]|uniref:hypothetical protein n=1 Tax=Nonomuraea indica TaxID=1581193 RepID=UPI000C7B4B0E|nr:hypothetical protein [Nonomuraea indica]